MDIVMDIVKRIIKGILIVVVVIAGILAIGYSFTSEKRKEDAYNAVLDDAAKDVSVIEKTEKITGKGSINNNYWLYVDDTQISVPQNTYDEVQVGNTFDYIEYSLDIPSPDDAEKSKMLTGVARNEAEVNSAVEEKIAQCKQTYAEQREKERTSLKYVFLHILYAVLFFGAIIFIIELILFL